MIVLSEAVEDVYVYCMYMYMNIVNSSGISFRHTGTTIRYIPAICICILTYIYILYNRYTYEYERLGMCTPPSPNTDHMYVDILSIRNVYTEIVFFKYFLYNDRIL